MLCRKRGEGLKCSSFSFFTQSLYCLIFFFGGLLVSLSASAREVNFPVQTRVFYVDYDTFWEASQKVFLEFPLIRNNFEEKVVKTDWVSFDYYWKWPDPLLGALEKRVLKKKYEIFFKKGVSKGQSAIKVLVRKKYEIRDGLSEQELQQAKLDIQLDIEVIFYLLQLKLSSV